MSIFQSMNTSASAMSAQRLRMDIASSNIANANLTRAAINEEGEREPYRRRMAVFQSEGNSFQEFLHKAANRTSPGNV